jgi:UDP-N-acetyl-D-mannosaminuronic acid transferase (WecB/TagA/CpsF family)
MINWPDGIFATFLNRKLKKIPGRDIVKKISIPNYIKKITVIGNLSKKTEFFLKKSYNREINILALPFGNINKIIKNLNYVISKDELIFITLPTPKQEQVAKYLKERNLYFKIICIGGSINIASGEEKEVPKYLSKLEFLWRLRYDTFRRISRLINTLAYYLLAILITKKFKNKSAKIL